MIKYNLESYNGLKAGVDALADAVKVTLGPKGRNVIISQNGEVHITKDGVTVARSVQLEDSLAAVGAQVILEAATQTNTKVGDGTTTSIVLAQAIFSEGIKNVVAGANPIEIKKGIDIAVEQVINYIKTEVIDISNNRKSMGAIATISANNDPVIGELIAELIEAIGPRGIVTLEDGVGVEDEVKRVEGMKINRGYLSQLFINNSDKKTMILEDPYVLIYNNRIKNIKEILPLLDKIVTSKKSLLIICDDIEKSVLDSIIINTQRGTFNVGVIKSPGHGFTKSEFLEDIAALVEGDIISNFDGVTLSNLGNITMATISLEDTVITKVSYSNDKLKEHIANLEKLILEAPTIYEKDKLQERIANITGGIATVYVGGISEVEQKERKDRIEDAIRATQAALTEGILPGGGIMYLNAIESLKELKLENPEQQLGVNIIAKALEAPIRQIVNNTGEDSSLVVGTLRAMKVPLGYNAKTGQFENLITAGVIDAAMVTRVALENAASVAGTLLTTDCVIIN